MGLYVRKPNTEPIEAIQFGGDNIQEIWESFGSDGIYSHTEENEQYVVLTTLQGESVRAGAGEWIVPEKGVEGRFYPIDNSVFLDSFEPYDSEHSVGEDLGEAVRNIEIHKPNPPATHLISMSVTVNNPIQWSRIFGQFSELVENLGGEYPSATVSSHQLDSVDPEVEDEVEIDVDEFGEILELVGVTREQKLRIFRGLLREAYKEDQLDIPVKYLSEEDALATVRSVMLDEGLSPGTVNECVSRILRAGVAIVGQDQKLEPVVADFGADDEDDLVEADERKVRDLLVGILPFESDADQTLIALKNAGYELWEKK